MDVSGAPCVCFRSLVGLPVCVLHMGRCSAVVMFVSSVAGCVVVPLPEVCVRVCVWLRAVSAVAGAQPTLVHAPDPEVDVIPVEPADTVCVTAAR